MDRAEREDRRSASVQATLMNAHFDHKGVPWTAEDVMGKTDRRERIKQQMRDKAVTMRSRIKAALSGGPGGGGDGELPEMFRTLAANRPVSSGAARPLRRNQKVVKGR